MNKKFAARFGGALLAGSFALSLLAAAPANAATTDETEIRSWMSSHQISEQDQAGILAKLRAGDLPDSSQPGAIPVSSSSVIEGNWETVTSRFADGSVLVSGLERAVVPAGTFRPNSISGCSYSTGSGYTTATNCRIYQDSSIGTIEFRANYQRYSGGSQITNARQASMSTRYGTADAPSLTIAVAKGNATVPAVATAHTKYTSHNSSSSEDVYLSLRVTAGSAYTTTY
jgi:hypothetical protein